MYIERSELEEKLESFIGESCELCLLLQRIGKWKAAIQLLTLGIDWAEDVLQKARLQIILGEIYSRQAHYDEAQKLLEAAHKCTKEKPTKNIIQQSIEQNEARKSVLAKALFALGELHYFRYVFTQSNTYSVAWDTVSEARDLFEELGDFHSMTGVLTRLGIMLDNQGNEAAARNYYEQAIALADKLNCEKGKIMALAHLGIIYQRNGDLEDALYYQEMSLDISQRVGQADRIMHALGHIGMIQYQLFGDLKLALFKCKEALKIAEKLEHPAAMCLMLKRLGRLSLESQNQTDAKQYFEQLQVVAEAHGFVGYMAVAADELSKMSYG